MPIVKPFFATLRLLALGVIFFPFCPRVEAAVEAWVQRFSNPALSSDVARRVVTDDAGNLIVVGYTEASISGTDVAVLKYSSAGDLLWSRRYNGPENSTDEPHAVAVDNEGKIFVAGSSFNGTNNDLLVIAYSSTGVLLWTNRYDGPSGLDDAAAAIATDGNGDVIVAGASESFGTWDDYLIIKYSNAGVPLWTNAYSGVGTVDDQALAVAVDGDRNVFVSGVGSLGYVTIAYAADGLPMWTNTFYGAVSGIAVDGNGNVFVTGYSFDPTNSNNYATVAYSGGGLPLWTNFYNGPANEDDTPAGIVVDNSGTVFVTGSSRSGFVDYVTIAYANSGVPLWTNRYDGPANFDDTATAIAVDSVGNVFVTGYSDSADYSSLADYATVAYSNTGVALWTNRYDGTSFRDEAKAIAVNTSGNVFVSGYSTEDGGIGYDIATIAYMGDGTGLWTNRFNWPGNKHDLAQAVALDNAGNVYVTGLSSAAEGTANSDFATIAYSSSGLPLWTNRYTGPENHNADPSAIAVHNGKVFVTGSVYSGADVSLDYATIAYSTAGVPLWTNYFNGRANWADVPTALTVGPNGNVYVTGYSTVVVAGGNHDYLTIAYTSDGVPLWTNSYGRSSSIEAAYAIAVDSANNVYVTGFSGISTSRDYVTIAYTAAGLPAWTNVYNGPGNRVDEAYAIAIDGDNNVIVTGSSDGGGSTYDYATIKYSSAGLPLWTNRYDVGMFDSTRSLATDSSGNIFVTGTAGSFGDFTTIAYSPEGTALWVQRFSGPDNSPDTANAIAVDPRGDVIITGSSYNGADYDIVTIAYSNSGAPLWTNRYNGPAQGDDQVMSSAALAIGPHGSVIVVGASDGNYADNVNTHDFVTIKYETVPRLSATLKNSNIELSWDLAFIGWRLQAQTNGLNAGLSSNWMEVPGVVFTNRVSVPATNASAFFRLLSP